VAAERRIPVWVAGWLVAACAALPLVYVLVRAAGAGSRVWSDLLDGRLPTLLANTLGLAAVAVAGTLVLGTTLAYLVVRTDLPGRRGLAVLCALPLAIPPYVGSVTYGDVLGPRGGLRDLLGVEEIPSIFGFPGAALVLILFTYPYVFLLAAAALRNLNPHFEEAARGLGRGTLRVFFGTTMRLVAPSLVAGALLVGLYVLSDFGTVSLMRFQTFTTVIYDEIGGRFDPPAAAALSSVLVLLTLAFLAGGLAARGGGRFVQTEGGFAEPRLRPLGRARWPALAAVLAVLGLSLALPIARLATWTVDVLPDQDLGDYLGWAWNSVLVSVLGATITVVCALPVAALMASRRRSGMVAGWLAQAGYALPGVIVALALVAIATRWIDPLYGTLALLVAAYVIRFLPQAIQGEEAGLQQIGPNLVEAARGLGASGRQAVWRVVLPLMRPSLAAAWAVVFLTVVKELPATLILRPLGFDTLPVRVWVPAHDALYAQAGPPALLLVIISAVPLYLLLGRRANAREGVTLPG
jgi:iron(III) transport system permease protein